MVAPQVSQAWLDGSRVRLEVLRFGDSFVIINGTTWTKARDHKFEGLVVIERQGHESVMIGHAEVVPEKKDGPP